MASVACNCIWEKQPRTRRVCISLRHLDEKVSLFVLIGFTLNVIIAPATVALQITDTDRHFKTHCITWS